MIFVQPLADYLYMSILQDSALPFGMKQFRRKLLYLQVLEALVVM